jgi:hypothetical protein
MTPLKVLGELSPTAIMSSLNFSNFSGVSLLRIPRTLRKSKSSRSSGESASRLKLEGGTQRFAAAVVDGERESSLQSQNMNKHMNELVLNARKPFPSPSS